MKEIIQYLEHILRYGYSPFTVFNDWLDLMLFALQRDDEHYLEIVRRYKNDQKEGEREIDYFCKAFALLQTEMQKTGDDILGQVYMEWNQHNKFRGQFFTPKPVASFMAKCIAPKGKILDPCCGSGIMLIEAIKTMSNADLDESVFYGQDIDLTCVKMCALNLLFFNVNGFVIWGDTLAMECKKVYETGRSCLGGSIRELTGDTLENFKESYRMSIGNTVSGREKEIKEMTDDERQELTKSTEQLILF